MIAAVANEGFSDIASVEVILSEQGKLDPDGYVYLGSFKKFDDYVKNVCRRRGWHGWLIDLSHGVSPDERMTMRDDRIIKLMDKYKTDHPPFPPRLFIFSSSGLIGSNAYLRTLAENRGYEVVDF